MRYTQRFTETIACPTVDYAADVNMRWARPSWTTPARTRASSAPGACAAGAAEGAGGPPSGKGLAARIDRAMAAQLALERRGCPDLDGGLSTLGGHDGRGVHRL